MESENVRVVRRVYELYGALDTDPAVRMESDELRELMGLFAPDVEFTTVAESPEAGTYPHGVSTENLGGGVFTLRDGRIVRFTAALTWERARELWNAASG